MYVYFFLANKYTETEADKPEQSYFNMIYQ